MNKEVWGKACARAIGAAALAGSLLLGACGGGDSHDEPPPLAVKVTANGTAAVAHPLANGESAAINVPSGATLVFDSEHEARWAPTATDSSYHVNSFSFTSKSLTVTSNPGGTLVVVFTNKADETQKATLTVTVAPQEFGHVARTDGEVETWLAVGVDGDGSTYESGTLYRSELMEDGAYGVYLGNPVTGLYSTRRSYDAQDRYLGYSALGANVTCRYDHPIAEVSYPMHVGKTWSGTGHRDCGAMNYLNYDQSYARTVEAFERITVPEGTHDTLRVHVDIVYANINDDPNSSPQTTTGTCWWAVDLGRNIKCEYVNQGDGYTSSQTLTLTQRQL